MIGWETEGVWIFSYIFWLLQASFFIYLESHELRKSFNFALICPFVSFKVLHNSGWYVASFVPYLILFAFFLETYGLKVFFSLVRIEIQHSIAESNRPSEKRAGCGFILKSVPVLEVAYSLHYFRFAVNPNEFGTIWINLKTARGKEKRLNTLYTLRIRARLIFPRNSYSAGFFKILHYYSDTK